MHESMITDWKVERMVLGELPEDPAASARIEALLRSNAEILDRYRCGPMARAIEARAPRTPRAPRRSMLALAPAVALGAVLLLCIPPRGHHVEIAGGAALSAAADEVILEKGLEPTIRVYRRGADRQTEQLSPDSVVVEGDLLQVSYVAAGRTHGVVFSIDGRGEVVLHFPDPRGDTALGGSGAIALPHAYELDDAPDFERFFFVASTDRVSVRAVLEAARKLAADPTRAGTAPLVLPGVDQATLTLRKAD